MARECDRRQVLGLEYLVREQRVLLDTSFISDE